MTGTTSDVVVIVAPAGYGKTRYARRIAVSTPDSAWCDCSERAVEALAKNVLDALASESARSAYEVAEQRALAGQLDSALAVEVAQRAWTVPLENQSTFVFDNCELAFGDAATVELLATLVNLRPAGRRVVIASRVGLPRKLSRVLAPDRTDFVCASDLRIDEPAACAMLAEAGAVGADAQAAIRIADGWPMALSIFCRFASEGRLGEELSATRGAANESLISYLVREYVDHLAPSDFDAMVLSACLPIPTALEVADLTQTTPRDFAAVLERLPFVQTDTVGRLTAHPVVSALVEKRYGTHGELLVSRAIARSIERLDWIRAAEIVTARGDGASATRYLASLGANDITAAVMPRLVTLLGRLDRDAVLDQPRVWVHTIEIRRFGIPMHDLVSEARRVLALISAVSEPQLYFEVVRLNVSILMHAGKIEDAETTLCDARERLDDPESLGQLRVLAAAVASVGGKYVAAREQYRSASAHYPELMARYLDLIDATTALRSGRYDVGLAMLEEAARVQRRNCWVAPLLVTLSNLAFETWAVGDEERFARAVAELKSNLLAGHEPAWLFWLAAANGEQVAETGYEPITIRAMGYLFLAASKIGPERVRFARAAAGLAQESGDVGLTAYALVALAEFDDGRRAEANLELASIARQVDLEEFRSDVLAHATGSPKHGSLATFVRQRLRGAPKAFDGIDVYITSGRTERANETVSLTLVEAALLQFLATYQRPASRQVLCDALWPDADETSAANNLKVVVHRIRKKLGQTAVALVANGYCLGPHLRVDLFEDERLVRRVQVGGAVTPADCESLLRIGIAVGDHRRDEFLKYEWYAAIDRRLTVLRREALLIAARSLWGRGEFERARAACDLLLSDDEDDEEAREILVLWRERFGPVTKSLPPGSSVRAAVLD